MLDNIIRVRYTAIMMIEANNERGKHMHTRHKTLGKFQGNDSEMIAKAVYNATMDGCCESLGESGSFGWYAYVNGKRYDFIITENSQGFVYVEYGKPEEMLTKWESIEKDYAEWCSDGEDEEEED